MTLPLLTLLAAGSLQWAPEQPDLQRLAIEIVLSVGDIESLHVAPDVAPDVADVPFYFDRLMPVAEPAAPLLVTYDWRSPVVFDLP